jgi:malonate-semialdehyde dehydrogenase (acetylating)/methylmalonate-semialdehyde dehydrogenase
MSTEAMTDVRTLANHVAGGWAEATGAETLVSRNPATGEPLALVPLSGAAEVDAAVRAARAALPGWRATSPVVRARAVMALRETLVAHRE